MLVILTKRHAVIIEKKKTFSAENAIEQQY